MTFLQGALELTSAAFTSLEEISAVDLLDKLRAIGVKGTCFDSQSFSWPKSAELNTAIFYQALGSHVTADDLDSRFKGITPLLRLFQRMSCDCSPDERVQLFVVSSGFLPSFQWPAILRYTCGTEDEPCGGDVFLQTFVDSTSNQLTSGLASCSSDLLHRSFRCP